jgi:threonine dehydrogenase-like Zn-dependent dehydrogenase
MQATLMYGERDIRIEEVPDPELTDSGLDAIVRVVAACVCGSDLWGYRGVVKISEPRRFGHEFVGIVDRVGADVTKVAPGDFVIAPFYDCDMTCQNCLNGVSSACLHGGSWGAKDRSGGFADGGQGEWVRVPHADGTLVVVPGLPTADQVPGLLSLSDVMSTGHHAALCADVHEGSTVVVVGDGAVGLCGVIAAKRLGASRIVVMSRNPARQALAREFGATDIIEERGDEGISAVLALFGGIGADSVLECVGTEESMQQATKSARPGGTVGYVGVPHGGLSLPLMPVFWRNVGVRGGVAPARNYIEELLPEVLSGAIQPGRVFDLQLPLAEVAEAYAAMDERRAVKVLLRP